MEVNIKTLQEIFSPDVRFCVPLYQRRYVWDKANQWEPLWEDVISVADQIFKDEQMIPHFLGAIVVMQQHTSTGDLGIRNVVDGQQRLTTLQLLIDAVEEIVADIGPQRESVRLRKLLINDDDLYQGDELFKVWPTNIDRLPFRRVMTDSTTIDSQTATTSIAMAHSWFKDVANSWIDANGANYRDKRIQSLVTAITHGLNVAVIDLGQGDNAQAIFETLNARGTPLLPSDLIKNHLLQRASEEGKDADVLYQRHWSRFDSSPWSDEKSARLNSFLYHWTFMESAPDEISERHLFRDFSRLVKDCQIADILVSIDEAADSYEYLLDSEAQLFETHRAFLERWRIVDLRVLTPLLMWLVIHQEETGSENVDRALAAIESWFMRRIVIGARAAGYNNLVYSVLGAAKAASPTDVSDAILNSLQQASGRNAEWPDDHDVWTSVVFGSIFNKLRRARLRVILEAIEDHKRNSSGKAEQSCPKNLTIEHILPQGWTIESWPLTSPHHDAEDRIRLLHSLGNLTLVNESLNPSMSNAAWVKKRQALDEHSVLYLNRELIDMESWDEEAIEKRNSHFSELICEIWPRPSH